MFLGFGNILMKNKIYSKRKHENLNYSVECKTNISANEQPNCYFLKFSKKILHIFASHTLTVQ